MCIVCSLTACAGKVAPGLETYVGERGSLSVWHEAARVRSLTLREGADGALRVYIEGDGRAYVDGATPSRDPTPFKPVGLQLALSDNDPEVGLVYMGRPCQWQPAGAVGCGDNRLWTIQRFDGSVVEGQVDVIEGLAAEADQIVLVGFSGGAFIAQMAAVRLRELGKDVQLVTVAGNVDPAAVNAYHRVPTPDGWLGWQEVASDLRSVPQVHYVGHSDRIVPPAIARRYVDALGAGVVREVEATHLEGWSALGF